MIDDPDMPKAGKYREVGPAQLKNCRTESHRCHEEFHKLMENF